MYFPLNMVIFHCYVSVPEGTVYRYTVESSWSAMSFFVCPWDVVICVFVEHLHFFGPKSKSFRGSLLKRSQHSWLKGTYLVSCTGGHVDDRCNNQELQR